MAYSPGQLLQQVPKSTGTLFKVVMICVQQQKAPDTVGCGVVPDQSTGVLGQGQGAWRVSDAGRAATTDLSR